MLNLSSHNSVHITCQTERGVALCLGKKSNTSKVRSVAHVVGSLTVPTGVYPVCTYVKVYHEWKPLTYHVLLLVLLYTDPCLLYGSASRSCTSYSMPFPQTLFHHHLSILSLHLQNIIHTSIITPLGATSLCNLLTSTAIVVGCACTLVSSLSLVLCQLVSLMMSTPYYL